MADVNSGLFDDDAAHTNGNGKAHDKDLDSFEDAFASEKEGWLLKRGDVRKNWRKRYCVLKNNDIKYFKKPEDKEPKGEIKLEGCSVEMVAEDKYGKKFCFELHSPLRKRMYILVAESGTEMQDWLTEIRKAMLRIRRQKSKDAANQRRVSEFLKEQEEKAKQRVGIPIPIKEEPENKESESETSPFVLPNGVEAPADASNDDKYQMYLKWLTETRSHQRRGTVPDRHTAYTQGSSMHERLLMEDESEEKKRCAGVCKGCVIM